MKKLPIPLAALCALALLPGCKGEPAETDAQASPGAAAVSASGDVASQSAQHQKAKSLDEQQQ